MTFDYDVAVIGAGPAGLSAAIELVQSGWRVLVIEKAEVPREKVCGGFVGPENQEALKRLGVWEDLLAQGAEKITEAQLSASNGASVRIPINFGNPDSFGLGVSRKLMDWNLLRRAQDLGVTIFSESNVSTTSLEEGHKLEIKNRKTGVLATAYTRFLINASGAPKLKNTNQKGYYGIAARFKNVAAMDKTVFLHFVQGGHFGINQFENGETNCCYVADQELFEEVGGDLEKLFTVFNERNPVLKKQLMKAEQISSWKGMYLPRKKPLKLFENQTFYVGDSVGLINPVIGGGISLSLTSGGLLGRLLANYAPQDLPLAQVVKQYKQLWKKEFLRQVQMSKFWGFLSHQAFLAGPTIKLLNSQKHWLQKLFSYYHKPKEMESLSA